ncbi:MAG: FAD-dependent thymidylate synthase [Candidatus Kapabacteria bacterium]|nr:FAD-dependent thymidylate synthase [Candidatus Kapabacteria bacterium]
MINENIKEIIGKEYKCLNKGFVRLIDIMGDDSSIVQAARVSYGKGTKSVNEDLSLINYLMRNRHTSPFEMVELKFHIKLPIFVARQWIRHRTANVNEYSGRYSEMKNEFYIPESEQLRLQSAINKQGRSEELVDNETSDTVIEQMKNTQEFLFTEYENFLDKKIAREIARINLPLSTYTEWYWKIDLHNLFHFLELRLDHHAQYEIRVYGEVIADILKLAVPYAYTAFEDYMLNSVNLSKKELTALKEIISFDKFDQINFDSHRLKGRELSEFKEKIKKIINI